MQVLNSLLPIFAFIGLGAILRINRFIDKDATSAFNRFAYFIALPAFLFHKLSTSAPTSEAGNVTLVVLIATIATLIIAWLTTWLARAQTAQTGVVLQAAFRGNLAFIAIPLIRFALEPLPENQALAIETTVYVSLAPVVIFYNVAAVTALSIFGKDEQKKFSWSTILFNVFTNPILVACLAGWSSQTIGLTIPHVGQKTLGILGDTAFPIALLGIGSQLSNLAVVGSWSWAAIAAILKCVLCPALGWLAGWTLGMTGPELMATTILCGVPTAVSSYVLADQMGGDSDLAASTVLFSTSLSLVTLSVILIVFGS